MATTGSIGSDAVTGMLNFCAMALTRLSPNGYILLPQSGRTHQIRAHLAHEGYPIIGDDKYGDRPLDRHNRGLKLTAVRLEFGFDELSPLSYLNGKTISIQA